MICTATIMQFSAAALCLECDCLSDATGETCPYCGSAGSLMNLKRAMGRIAHRHEYDSGFGAVPVSNGHLILRCACGDTRSTSEFTT